MNYPQGGYGPQQQGYPPQQQQGWYGPPPPGYPPPRKNNTALIVAIAGVAVAAIVALVLVLVLTGDDDKKADSGSDNGGQPSAEVPGPNAPGNGGDDNDNGGGGSATSSPEALADAVVDIIETQDDGDVDALSCSPSIADELKGELSKLAGLDVTAQVSDVQESGDQAQATIDMEFEGQTEGITIEMEKQDSGWCAAGI